MDKIQSVVSMHGQDSKCSYNRVYHMNTTEYTHTHTHTHTHASKPCSILYYIHVYDTGSCGVLNSFLLYQVGSFLILFLAPLLRQDFTYVHVSVLCWLVATM